jgi:hypothetical protein
MTRRRFPPPWTFEEGNNACFIVKDANGFAVSYVYSGTAHCRKQRRRLGEASALKSDA